jgi:hypothetical protein
MGMMTAVTYISNRPSIWTRIWQTFEVIGYARAARELSRLGYYNEAKECMMQIKRIKD